MLLQDEQNYGLGMGALVTVSSWNTNEFMIWTQMDWLPCALATRTECWFGHGCTGYRMLLEHEGIMVWAWMHWLLYAVARRPELWFMDALVTVYS